MPNIASIGRFSSQMLTYLGAQKTVKTVNGTPTNTFKFAEGTVTYPSPMIASTALNEQGVSGSYAPNVYNSTKCYFLSRGVSMMYADTMTGIAIDISTMLGISTQALLEQITADGRLLLSEDAYRAFNMLRDPGNQVGVVTSVSNRHSLQAREIRA